MPRFLPEKKRLAHAVPLPYLTLLASLPKLLIQWSGLRLSAVLGACVFGAFSTFWATLAFHLAQSPFGDGSANAGLFGLWGAAGALIAPFCGRLSDRYGPTILNALSIAATLAAFACFVTGGDVSVFAIVVGVNLPDFGNQSGQIANQARIFKLDPAARARLNTVYTWQPSVAAPTVRPSDRWPGARATGAASATPVLPWWRWQRSPWPAGSSRAARPSPGYSRDKPGNLGAYNHVLTCSRQQST